MVLEGKALAKYTIMDVRIPPKADYESDVEWICRCFGFLEPRDKDKSAAKIFKSLLEAMKEEKGLSSDDLAEKISLTRGTVVHHLNKLIESGLAIHREGRYELRGMSLQKTIQEIRRDIDRILDNIEQVAKNIDQTLNLSYR